MASTPDGGMLSVVVTCRVPAPPLDAFVWMLWYSEGWQPAHGRERHMPDGTSGILIPLSGRGAPIVSGPRSRSIVLDAGGMSTTLIGAQFTHGGAAACLDVSLSALTNAHVPLADVCGESIEPLRERLLDAIEPHARLDILECWLGARMLRRPGADRAVAWAIHELRRPHARVSDVTSQIGRSARWFIRRFASDVGLTPKVFSRVQRFHAALRHAHRRPAVDLSDLALTVGYYDQSHLTHEFQEFAGMSPSALLAGRTEFLNHVVEPGASS